MRPSSPQPVESDSVTVRTDQRGVLMISARIASDRLPPRGINAVAAGQLRPAAARRVHHRGSKSWEPHRACRRLERLPGRSTGRPRLRSSVIVASGRVQPPRPDRRQQDRQHAQRDQDQRRCATDPGSRRSARYGAAATSRRPRSGISPARSVRRVRGDVSHTSLGIAQDSVQREDVEDQGGDEQHEAEREGGERLGAVELRCRRSAGCTIWTVTVVTARAGWRSGWRRGRRP